MEAKAYGPQAAAQRRWVRELGKAKGGPSVMPSVGAALPPSQPWGTDGVGRGLSMIWVRCQGQGVGQRPGTSRKTSREEPPREGQRKPWEGTDTGCGQGHVEGVGRSCSGAAWCQEAREAGPSQPRAGRGPRQDQSNLAKPPMVTFLSGLVPTGSWSCTAPPPMKQKAGHTGPEQSRGHSRSPRKDTASRKETRPCS